MSYGIPFDEDAYWERVREERENPRRGRHGWEEDEEPPKPESDTLFLDEEIEELENRYGCGMKELYEGDLIEIVEEFKNIIPITAEWNEQWQGIDYKYREECA